jgi:AGZA family xanthine/uracil permease-like MFS transporter
MKALLERTFELRSRKSTVAAEVRGAVATFLSMAYILAVNAQILSAAGMPTSSVIACTALAAAVCSIAMGLWANFPVALASGMGLNALIAGLTMGPAGMPWQTAMGLVVLDGVVITVLVLLGLREAVLRAIPHDLRLAIGAGIGLFIAFIGLVNAGVVARGPRYGPPVTYGALAGPQATVAVAGLLVTTWLVARRVKGALILGIVGSTALAAWMGIVQKPGDIGWPDLSVAFRADVVGALGLGWRVLLPLLLSLVMVDFFDTLGTVTGVADEAGLADAGGNVPRLRKVLLVDSLSASVGGLLGCSSVTSYVESAAGVAEGARTGLHTVLVGIFFLAAMFAAPLLAVIPPAATAPALVLVGFYMIGQFAKVDFEQSDTAIPAFITLITIPLTYSISHGIGYGFIAFVAIKLLSLRWRQVHPVMWITAAAFAAYLWHEGAAAK